MFRERGRYYLLQDFSAANALPFPDATILIKKKYLNDKESARHYLL